MTSDTASDLTAVATVVLAVIAFGTASFGLCEYRRAGRREKARWLTDLSGHFYEPDHYRDVYLAFDDQDPERLRLEKLNRLAAEAISDPTTEWELTRYLNFFELVASLCKRGELTREDVLLVFDYPLRRLAGQREIVGYLKPNGYGALDEFLSKNRQA